MFLLIQWRGAAFILNSPPERLLEELPILGEGQLPPLLLHFPTSSLSIRKDFYHFSKLTFRSAEFRSPRCIYGGNSSLGNLIEFIRVAGFILLVTIQNGKYAIRGGPCEGVPCLQGVH